MWCWRSNLGLLYAGQGLDFPTHFASDVMVGLDSEGQDSLGELASWRNRITQLPFVKKLDLYSVNTIKDH